MKIGTIIPLFYYSCDGIAANCGKSRYFSLFVWKLGGFLETKIRRWSTLVELLITMTGIS